MNGEYVSVAENEKYATFWEDVAEKKKQREEAVRKQKEEIENLQKETQRLAAELEMQKRRAEQEREVEAERRHQEEMSALQSERERLSADLAKHQQTQHHPEASAQFQYQDYPFSQNDYETLKRTVYGHAKQEPREAQTGVAFVIVNRARANQEYWGGTSINEVCRKPGQFWIGIFGEPEIQDWNMYNSIDEWLPGVLKGEIHDLTNGANHFLPHWETHHDWLSNVNHVASHGNFKFFKAKWLP